VDVCPRCQGYILCRRRDRDTVVFSRPTFALAKPCVNKAWKKSGDLMSMRKMAMQWLDALDRWYKEEHTKTNRDVLNEKGWHDTMESIKKAMERW
jgi:hypothetical protein